MSVKEVPAIEPMAVKKTTKVVRVGLGSNEQRQLGQAMANLMVQSEQVRDDMKKMVQELRGRLDDFRGTIRKHARTLCNGYKDELVEVSMYFDFTQGTVKTYHAGKVIEDRPMTDEEKQLDLQLCVESGMSLSLHEPGIGEKASVKEA